MSYAAGVWEYIWNLILYLISFLAGIKVDKRDPIPQWVWLSSEIEYS